MDENSDLIIAQEFDWLIKNEPTFRTNRNECIGKVGRTDGGEDIIIKIAFPEYYPFIRPDVYVVTNITHPNITSKQQLELQMLDAWEPTYRVKDILHSTRQLFLKSRPKEVAPVKQVNRTSSVESEILKVQQQINEITKQINASKAEKLSNAGVQSLAVGSMKISKKLDIECQILAINDLLTILEMKFEEAGIEQTDFFRLYRKYSRELYLQHKELEKTEDNNNVSVEKTERPLAN